MGKVEWGSWNAEVGMGNSEGGIRNAEVGSDWKLECGRRKKSIAQRAWYIAYEVGKGKVNI
jgi:hypothetical protein